MRLGIMTDALLSSGARDRDFFVPWTLEGAGGSHTVLVRKIVLQLRNTPASYLLVFRNNGDAEMVTTLVSDWSLWAFVVVLLANG